MGNNRISCIHSVFDTARTVCGAGSMKLSGVRPSVCPIILHMWWVCYCWPCTHTRLTAHLPGSPRWAGTRKVKPIWILLKQETVSGSGISWIICKSAPRSRQTTTPAPHHSVFTGRMPFLPSNQQHQSTECRRYRSIAARTARPRAASESSVTLSACVGSWAWICLTGIVFW